MFRLDVLARDFEWLDRGNQFVIPKYISGMSEKIYDVKSVKNEFPLSTLSVHFSVRRNLVLDGKPS